MRAAALAVAALVLAAPAAEGARALGRPWPGGRIAYAVTVPALRGPVRTAAAAWNRSGARVRFVEVSRSRAQVLIGARPRGTCQGVVGLAQVGYTGGARSRMQLQATCAPGVLVMTAAHELGHVLGLAHEDRRCSLMNSVFVARCRPRPLDWEWFCSPPRDDDRRGAVQLYGGRFRRATATFCLARGMPGRVTRLGDAADPVDSLARVRLSFQTPTSTSLRRVIVTRRRGSQCGDTPISRAVPIQQREGVTPRLGNLVSETVNPRRGAVMAVEDLAVSGTGTWCYSVFTLDRRNRWRLAGTRKVRRGAERPLAQRIALTASPAAPSGITLQWRNPTTPLAAVQVLRAPGACPANGALPAYASASPTAGPVSFTDPAAGPGTWCYGLQFTSTAPGMRRPIALVQTTRA